MDSLGYQFSTLRSLANRYLILIIDFDNDFDKRKDLFEQKIPTDIWDRVYLLGCKSEPEDFHKRSGQSFEQIGRLLATACVDDVAGMWDDPCLSHNKHELDRLTAQVKCFLFA